MTILHESHTTILILLSHCQLWVSEVHWHVIGTDEGPWISIGAPGVLIFHIHDEGCIVPQVAFVNSSTAMYSSWALAHADSCSLFVDFQCSCKKLVAQSQSTGVVHVLLEVLACSLRAHHHHLGVVRQLFCCVIWTSKGPAQD